MLGDGAVGKSAITVQFVQRKFVTDYDPTIENSYRKQMSIKDGKEEHNCMLDILDTAGQEEYSVMRQQYISRGTGFVLVFSLTSDQSLHDVKKFRKEVKRVKKIDQSVDHIPMILLGNKSDLKRAVTPESVKELVDKWGVPYFETSAMTGENIVTAFEHLVGMMISFEKGGNGRTISGDKLASKERSSLKSLFKKCVIS